MDDNETAELLHGVLRRMVSLDCLVILGSLGDSVKMKSPFDVIFMLLPEVEVD